MKALTLSLVALVSFSSFAKDVVCTGTVDGKKVKVTAGFSSEKSAYESLELEVEGEKIATKYEGRIKTIQEVYGTIIENNDPHTTDGYMLLLAPAGGDKGRDTLYLYLKGQLVDPNYGSPVDCK